MGHVGLKLRASAHPYRPVTRVVCKYSGKNKYVNPLEFPGFMHELVMKCDLIFI